MKPTREEFLQSLKSLSWFHGSELEEVDSKPDTVYVKKIHLDRKKYELPIYYTIFGKLVAENSYNEPENLLHLKDVDDYSFSMKHTDAFPFEEFIALYKECSINSYLKLIDLLFERHPSDWELQ